MYTGSCWTVSSEHAFIWWTYKTASFLIGLINRFNRNLKKQNLGIFYNSVKATISTNQLEFKRWHHNSTLLSYIISILSFPAHKLHRHCYETKSNSTIQHLQHTCSFNTQYFTHNATVVASRVYHCSRRFIMVSEAAL